MAGPTDYRAEERLRDGTNVTIRAIRANDKAAVLKAFAALDPESIYSRFHHRKRELTADDLRRLTEVDPVRDVALVVTIGAADAELFIGGGRYMAGGASAEVAFTIEEDFQRRGLAGMLLRHLVQIARANGIERFEAYVLKENAAMLRVFRSSGVPVTTELEDGVWRVTLQLA